MDLNAAALVLTAFVCFVAAIWAKTDGNARGKPGWLVALMVISTGIVPGLLIWLVFRPDRK